jgi:ATP citrate (pro-S)-lyase
MSLIISRPAHGQVTKPVVAWCIGTCASKFATDVQFGHAGASANAERETAVAKNKALAAAGAHVPKSFDDFGLKINQVCGCLRWASISHCRQLSICTHP